MINAKVLINDLLDDERITTLVEDVLDFYPNEIETFPT